MTLLSSSLAGTWYPGDANALRRQVRSFLDAAPKTGFENLCALLVPHAGYAYSGPTAGAAFREIEGRSFRRVVVIGPSHRLPLRDAALVPDAEGFRTPLGVLAADTDAVEKLRAESGFRWAGPGEFEAEHSVSIQFPFLQVAAPEARVVPLVVGRLSDSAADSLAHALRPLLTRDSLLVISSDFTHFGPSFGYVPFQDDIENRLRRLDLGAFEYIRYHDRDGFRAYLDETGATICGADPIRILLTLLRSGHEVHRLAYATSGRETGDWAHSVSYLAAAVSGAWKEHE